MILIYSLSVLFLSFILRENICEHVDMSQVRYTVNERIWLTRIFGSADYVYVYVPYGVSYQYLDCYPCKNKNNLYFECTNGEKISVTVHFRYYSQSCSVPLRIVCNEYVNHFWLSSLFGQAYPTSVKLEWSDCYYLKYVSDYVVFYMDGSNSYSHEFTPRSCSYLLTGLREKTLYQICIATIYNSRTGTYRCTMIQTDFSEYLPITYNTLLTTNNSAQISWHRSSDLPRQHNGFIIYYQALTSYSCGVIIINMDYTTITDIHYTCTKRTNARDHYNAPFHSYKIENLKPYTNYIIKIRAVMQPKYSKEAVRYFTTLQGESGPVSSLSVSTFHGFLHIEYDAPTNPNGVIGKYLVTVIRQNIGPCNQTQKVVFNATDIMSTTVDIPIMSPDKCAMYSIDVAPINGWTDNNGVGRSSSILFQYVPVNPEIYDEYIRFTNRQLHISWGFNTSSIGFIWEYILRFNDATDQCIKSVQFTCQDCDDYSSYDNINNTNKINKDDLLNCSTGQKIDFKQNTNTVYGEIDIAFPLRNFSVDIFSLSQLGINNIYQRKTNFKSILNDNITEIFHYIDSSRRNFIYFWRLKINHEAFIFEFIIRFSLSSGKCIKSINYICESRGKGFQQGNLNQPMISEWDKLRQCEQQSMEAFNEDKNFFGGSVNSNVTLRDITVSIYGFNRFGVHLLY